MQRTGAWADTFLLALLQHWHPLCYERPRPRTSVCLPTRKLDFEDDLLGASLDDQISAALRLP